MSAQLFGVLTLLGVLALALLFLGRVVLRIWKVARTFRAIDQKNRMRCPVCQYSLEKNVSGICPECGTPTALGPDGISRAKKIA